METKTEKLQRIWHDHEAPEDHRPMGTREAVEKAVEEGFLELPEIDPYDVLAGQMANALRRRYPSIMPSGLANMAFNTHFGRLWVMRPMITWKKLLLSAENKLSGTAFS